MNGECPVRSSITEASCLLPEGHEPYAVDRFHKYGPSPIAVNASRPEWVSQAIRELHRSAAAIDSQLEVLTKLSFSLGTHDTLAPTVGLADAAHDLEHARTHLTSVRRALVMTWPSEEDA